ncbi:MAG: hypothetical protein ACPG3Z_03670 [Saprospiraceae bacterium]
MSRVKSILKTIRTTESQVSPLDLQHFVYAKDGIGLYIEPNLYSQQIAHLLFGESLKLVSLDFKYSFRYKWYKTIYKGLTAYVSEKWIGHFPVPKSAESLETYVERLKDKNYDVETEIYQWNDRYEVKVLFPSTNMREIFLIATQFYPIDFKFPKSSNKTEEVITKIDDDNDIYEEFETTRNRKGDIIMIDYIADYGNSSDSIMIRKRSDAKILLSMGSYCQK